LEETVVGGRILVVDDDMMLRRSVARILEEEGYEVAHATDGADALAQIRNRRPDAILLDVMMPRMNGREVLEQLRSNAQSAGIPVVIMTALQTIDPDRAEALGADDLVEKPFDVDVLLNKVALALFRAGNMTV
jgi:two-component system response regulator MprA